MKDSLRVTMALVAHFDLELHQMDVKMTFLNCVCCINLYPFYTCVYADEDVDYVDSRRMRLKEYRRINSFCICSAWNVVLARRYKCTAKNRKS